MTFTSPLSRKEALLGWLFVPVFAVVLPLLLKLLVSYWPVKVSQAQQSTVYYLIGFLYVLIFLYRSLRQDWDALWDNKLRAVFTLILTHLLNVILSFAVALLTVALWEDAADAFTSEIPGVSSTLPEGMFTPLVLLAPLAEEALFRGVVFGTLRKRSRAAAYLVSIVLFAVHSTWQIAVANPEISPLFLAALTLPNGVAAAFCYERTNNIWVPALYRALVSLVPTVLASL